LGFQNACVNGTLGGGESQEGKKLKIKTHSGLNSHEIMENGTTYATFARAFFELNFNQEKMLLNFFCS
jgi:hypothetical protein